MDGLTPRTPDGAYAVSADLAVTAGEASPEPPEPTVGSTVLIRDLPHGHWVLVRDPRTLKQKHRRQVLIASSTDGKSQVESGLDATEALLTYIVLSWSYPCDVPSKDAGVYGEFDPEDYDALVDAMKPHMERLFPNTEPSPDPSSPTGPSAV